MVRVRGHLVIRENEDIVSPRKATAISCLRVCNSHIICTQISTMVAASNNCNSSTLRARGLPSTYFVLGAADFGHSSKIEN